MENIYCKKIGLLIDKNSHVDSLTNKLFYIIENGINVFKKLSNIDNNFPVINSGFIDNVPQQTILFNSINKNGVLYNTPKALFGITNNKLISKIHSNHNIIPRFVKCKEYVLIDKLKLPIIAKGFTNNSGENILFVDKAADVLNLPKKYKIFQEYKKIKLEYRIFVYNKKIYGIYQKFNNIENKGSNQLENIFIPQDLDKFNDNFFKMVKYFIRIINKNSPDLNVYSFDIIKDYIGKYWLMGLNSNIWGMYKSLELYKIAYESHYNKIPDSVYNKIWNEYLKEYMEDFYIKNKNYIDKSKNSIF